MTRVSIGLPTYNGVRHLAATLEGLLGQTWTDLELLVVDNASTDGTREVAESYAASDHRVRVVSNAVNIGAVGNFNRAYAETTGELFLWAADHDLYDPSYVEACVALLDDPTVVLAYTGARFLSDDGAVQEEIRSVVDTRGLDGVARFSEVVWGLGPYSYAIYGVIRRSALASLRRHPDVYPATVAPDLVLLAELALVGAFAYDPRTLFTQRRLPDHGSWEAGMDKLGIRPSNRREAATLYARMAGGMAGAVHEHLGRPTERAAALASLAATLATTYAWVPRTLWQQTRSGKEKR